MKNINSMDAEMRDAQFSRRHRRLLVVGSALIIIYFFLDGSILSWVKLPLSSYASMLEVVSFLLATLISIVCQYRLYHLNTTRIANVSEGVIDERQRMVRHAAYQRAYRIILWIVAIMAIAAFISFFASPRFTSFAFGSYVGLLWLMVALPTWVIAWTEREG